MRYQAALRSDESWIVAFLYLSRQMGLHPAFLAMFFLAFVLAFLLAWQ